MGSVKINSNYERSTQIATDYFSFQWKKKIKEETMLRMSFFTCIGFLFLFCINYNWFFLSISFIALCFVLYSLLHFAINKRKYYSDLKKKNIQDYEFIYSNTGLVYIFDNASSHFDWSFFKNYSINNDAVYLYRNDNSSLFDIFTESRYGGIAFSEI
jgi:hypothetical protein